MSKRLLFLAAIATSLPLRVFADVPSRPANPQEIAVIEKVAHALDATFARFGGPDWQEKESCKPDHYDVALETSAPLNFAIQCSAKIGIRPGSPLFIAKVAPVIAQLQNAKDLQKSSELARQIDGKLEFTVEAEANTFSIRGDEADLTHDLGAKGAAFSYCDRAPQLDCYVIFGSPARWKPDASGGRDFVYASRKSVPPAVENLSIHFHAKSPAGMAADRVREIIRTTDWSPIQASLTTK